MTIESLLAEVSCIIESKSTGLQETRRHQSTQMLGRNNTKKFLYCAASDLVLVENEMPSKSKQIYPLSKQTHQP